MHRWSLLAAVFACAARVVAQTKCAELGIDVPSVMTLVASPTKPDDALVVQPGCRDISTRLVTFMATLTLNDKIERVDSVPSTATSYEFTGCPLSAGFDLSAATGNIGAVFISGASATAFRNSIFPRSVDSVSIVSSPIESLDTTAFPSTMQSLTIRTTQLRTLPQLPSSVTSLLVSSGQLGSADFTVPSSVKILKLDSNPISALKQAHLPPAVEQFSCTNCKLTSIDGLSWPATLTNLDLGSNPITALDKVTLPSRLRFFACANCGLTLIRGVKWPAALTSLSLGGKVQEFEIRASDATVLEKLSVSAFDTSAFTSKCSDSSAKMRQIGRFKACVITDKRFNQLYGDGGGDSDGSLGSTTSSTSASASTATSASSDSPGDSSTSGNGNGGGKGGGTGGTGSNSDTPGGSSANPDDPGMENGVSDGNTTGSASSSLTTIIVVIVSVCIAAILALVGFRFLSRRRSERGEGDKEFQALRTSINASEDLTATTGKGSHPSSGPSVDMWKRDIRRDPEMIAHRIDLRLLKLGKPIARGGFGVVYKGEYNGEEVAVKRLAPDALQDEAKVYGFMDEIRMCATLQHPKIVTFIGVVWSTLRDISVVIEFMDGGDLHGLLQEQPVPSSPQDWFEAWTATRMVKSKASIACDVVEAIVYLHSFDTPIVHRDLKARNVLLDSQGNAKLSDFGISRERSVDETMTGGVGTVAWIAPEVLRGDRYSEKADIYSLGVLLVELDRCRHPYAGMMPDSSLANGSVSGTGLEFKDARIAMLVGAGQLRPEVSADSPSSVKELVARCLQLEAGDRPSAAEVLEYLYQIGRV